MRKRDALRRTLLFALMAALCLLAARWAGGDSPVPRALALAGGLAAAAFLAGWTGRCRRPVTGAWVAGGAVAAVIALQLVAPVAVEIERVYAETGLVLARHRAEAAPRGPRNVDPDDVDRAVAEGRALDERFERAWSAVPVLGLALAPCSLLGALGALLGENRRRKRLAAAEGPAAPAPAPAAGAAPAPSYAAAPGPGPEAAGLPRAEPPPPPAPS